ncbi:DUF1427 family protein [Roseibium sp. RKSG952]|uniref:DUF1427 family protein n=1 Tax=Roseibium sp. RKSG952 TaxID=2529384 RepID=UPI001AD91DBA
MQHGKYTLGVIVAFTIGAGCKLTGIPLPAPPVLEGSLVVASMTVGHVVVDRITEWRARKSHSVSTAPNRDDGSDKEAD